MHRFVTTAGLAALLGGCAAVDMPDVEATHPEWVEGRLEAGVEERTAPRTQKQTSAYLFRFQNFQWLA